MSKLYWLIVKFCFQFFVFCDFSYSLHEVFIFLTKSRTTTRAKSAGRRRRFCFPTHFAFLLTPILVRASDTVRDMHDARMHTLQRFQKCLPGKEKQGVLTSSSHVYDDHRKPNTICHAKNLSNQQN